jgi:hypothetical protein
MAKKSMNAVLTATELVQKRAYEVFLSRGEAHGADLADWLEAERQLQEEGLLGAPKAPRRTAKKQGSVEQPA